MCMHKQPERPWRVVISLEFTIWSKVKRDVACADGATGKRLVVKPFETTPLA